MTQVEYTVVLIQVGQCPEMYKKIKDTLDIAKGAYATEMSLMTGADEIFYNIDKDDEPEAMYCLAVDKKNTVLGFIYLETDTRTMTLWTSHVYVRPEARKKGVYSLMMKRVKKFAQDCKFRRIFSIVHTSNVVSQCAHCGAGFDSEWMGFELYVRGEKNEN